MVIFKLLLIIFFLTCFGENIKAYQLREYYVTCNQAELDSIINNPLENISIIKCAFCFYTYFGHGTNCKLWISSSSRLTAKHHTVCTIKNCIGNISGLRSSWPGGLDHGFQHLCCCHNRLSLDVALVDHHFLCQKYLFNWKQP